MSRFLARIRLSVKTDESTSVERQREVITGWAGLHGHTIVGWAEDIDVSGKLSPFDAPQLGDWLKNRHPEFDGIVAWKLDRLARNMFGLNDLFQWARANDKTVVSITESLDLSTTVGVMVAQFLAGVAQMELEAIQARCVSSQAYLRTVGRWAGGTVPYGYRSVKTGNGYRLDIDPATAPVMLRIVDTMLNGGTLAGTCAQLQAENIPAPRGGQQWSPSALRGILISPVLRGYRVHKRQVVLGDDGQPVVIGPELIDAETFQRLQATLAANATGKGRKSNASPLSGLLACNECELPLSHDTRLGRGKYRRYYRGHKNCDHVGSSIRAERLEHAAEMVLLLLFGEREITRRQWVPGNDNATALADAIRRATALGQRLGKTTSATMANVLQGQLDAVEAELARLESLPQTEGHWEQVGTGQYWDMAWIGADADERRGMLREAGLSFLVGENGAVAVLGGGPIKIIEA
jgi:site-specific DNA recombinase